MRACVRASHFVDGGGAVGIDRSVAWGCMYVLLVGGGGLRSGREGRAAFVTYMGCDGWHFSMGVIFIFCFFSFSCIPWYLGKTGHVNRAYAYLVGRRGWTDGRLDDRSDGWDEEILAQISAQLNTRHGLRGRHIRHLLGLGAGWAWYLGWSNRLSIPHTCVFLYSVIRVVSRRLLDDSEQRLRSTNTSRCYSYL